MSQEQKSRLQGWNDGREAFASMRKGGMLMLPFMPTGPLTEYQGGYIDGIEALLVGPNRGFSTDREGLGGWAYGPGRESLFTKRACFSKHMWYTVSVKA